MENNSEQHGSIERQRPLTEIEVNPGWLKDGQEPEWLREFRRVQIHIENALEYNANTLVLQDIVDQIATGDMHLWAGTDSAIITQIVQFPRRRALHVPFGGGNLAEITEMHSYIVEFAKQCGCQMITIAGRKGWERTFLKTVGFEYAYSVLKLEI